MILFLSLLGRAGHGKSSVAEHIRQKYGAKTVSLATPLKWCAMKVMGFTAAQLWGSQADKEAIDPRYGFSARRFLQLLGTEGLRSEFGENIHLDTLVQRTAKDYGCMLQALPIVDVERAQPDQIYIVDDARFRNEVSYLNSLPARFGSLMMGATIKIVCTDAPRPEGALAEHPSETEIDLVPESDLSATVISSRALGLVHLASEVDKAISTQPSLARFHNLRKAA